MLFKKYFAIALATTALLLMSSSHAEKATNPVIHADVPDVAVIRVGDTYYMSSTTMHMVPGLPIMKSKNLVDWEMLNYAYDMHDDIPDMRLETPRGAYGAGTWASSLRYHDGTYYVTTFSNTSGKTYIFRTDDIEAGNWQQTDFRPSLHDHSLIFDDDEGKVYLMLGGGNLRLLELESDLSGVKEGGFDDIVIHDAHDIVGRPMGLHAEGTQVLKVNGMWYVMNICWPRGGMRTQIIHRAEKLTGPYEGKVILEDKGVAQGCLIDTPEGDWYAMLFQDNGAVGRTPFLVPVKWEDGWPVLGIDGKVPMTLDIEDTQPVVGNVVASDDFDRAPGESLPLAWQWNHNPDNSNWSIGDPEGQLRITTGRVDEDVLHARNMLTQRTYGPTSSATTHVDVTGLKDGDTAGLIALQAQYGYVGVKQEDGNRSIVMVRTEGRGRDIQVREIESVPLDQDTAYFRIDCDFRNRTDKATFSYSMDGESWTRIGDTLQMAYTLPHFMGYRFGLFNWASKTAGGHADFDFYHTSPEISGD